MAGNCNQGSELSLRVLFQENLYRNLTLVGKTLKSTLSDMVTAGEIDRDYAQYVLQQFDESFLKTLQARYAEDCKTQGKLDGYNWVLNKWSLELKDVTLYVGDRLLKHPNEKYSGKGRVLRSHEHATTLHLDTLTILAQDANANKVEVLAQAANASANNLRRSRRIRK